MHDFTAQFQRENSTRIRRGQEPYADVPAYLVDQGFTEEEAKERAGGGATANTVGDEFDAATIYAKANRSHFAAVFGTNDSGASADDGHDVDETHAGRLPGINSPREYLDHLNSRKAPPVSTAETRDWNAIAESIYAGPINAQYRDAVAAARECS